MSVLKFELKSEHVALIKNLHWDTASVENLNCLQDDKSPFGGDSLYEDLGLIIYGKPEEAFDPTSDELTTYNDEQITNFTKLYSELRLALEVVTNRTSFELGHYKRKFHERNWVPYTPKK